MKRRMPRAGSPGVRRGRARPRSGQAGGLFCCCASCSWTSLSISSWRFCRTRLTMYSPKSHGQMRATTSPMRAASAQLGSDGVPRPVDPVHKKERQHPKDDPGDPPNHSRFPPSLGCAGTVARRPRRSLGVPTPRQSGDRVHAACRTIPHGDAYHVARPTVRTSLRATVDQRDLVERAKRGDHDAFAALAGAAVARLDAAARLILRDPELARDAVQEGFIRAWRNLPALARSGRFDAWLRRLVVNSCIDITRRRRRRPIEVELTPIDGPSTATSTSPSSPIASCSTRRSGASTPSGGPSSSCITSSGCRCPRWRRPCGIPLGTAKSRLHRSLAAMRVDDRGDESATDASRVPGGQVA